MMDMSDERRELSGGGGDIVDYWREMIGGRGF